MENGELDTLTQEEVGETSENTLTVEELQEQLAKANELANNYKIRAEKAESRSKETKPAKDQTTTNNPNVEEVVLKMNGISEEEIAMLKKVAIVNGTDLATARNDEMFVAWKDRKEQERKAEQARLGASRGSGSVREQKTFSSPGLSPKEHKELWKQSQK